MKAKGLLSQMLSLPEDWDYPSSKCSFGCPMRPCGVSQNPFAFSRRSFAREIPVLRPSSARLISFIPANSPWSSSISAMACAIIGRKPLSARALFKSVCKPLIGRGKGLRLKAFCLLEGNDAIRVIDPDHTGVLRRSFRFHFFSPLHIRFMIFIKACRLLPDRRQTSQLRRFSPRAAHSAQTPSSAAAVDQNARSG